MIRQAILSAPAGNTVGSPFAINPFRFGNVVVTWGPGVSAGSVAIKAAERAGDTADWPTLATVNFSSSKMAAAVAAGKTSYEDIVEITSPHGAVRADASSVAGGSVSAVLQAWAFGG
jgi:hypothetical protein